MEFESDLGAQTTWRLWMLMLLCAIQHRTFQLNRSACFTSTSEFRSRPAGIEDVWLWSFGREVTPLLALELKKP